MLMKTVPELDEIDELYRLKTRYDTLLGYYQMNLTITERDSVDSLVKKAKNQYFDYMRKVIV
jgi:hypothetical protein